MIDDYQKENLGNKYVYLVLYVTVDSLGFARQRLFRPVSYTHLTLPTKA